MGLRLIFQQSQERLVSFGFACAWTWALVPMELVKWKSWDLQSLTGVTFWWSWSGGWPIPTQAMSSAWSVHIALLLWDCHFSSLQGFPLDDPLVTMWEIASMLMLLDAGTKEFCQAMVLLFCSHGLKGSGRWRLGLQVTHIWRTDIPLHWMTSQLPLGRLGRNLPETPPTTWRSGMMTRLRPLKMTMSPSTAILSKKKLRSQCASFRASGR